MIGPASGWMPQVGGAERHGWSGEYTEVGVEVTRGFFGAIDDGSG